MDPVKVYGTPLCEETQHTRSHLDNLGIAYEFVDIDFNADAVEWVRRQNDGKVKTPTVFVSGFVMSVPSDGELDTALRSKGILQN